MANWARANRSVIPGVATGAHSANGRPTVSGSARARIYALISVASLVARAVGVIDTLSSCAGNERIAQVSGLAEADGSVVARTIGARFTVGVATARVRVAQVVLVERTAPVERVSRVALGARADGLVVFDAALGADAARSVARVHALEVEAGLVARAFLVLGTLGVAAGERVAEEVGRARADGAVVSDVAIGVGAASAARILAAEPDAGALAGALRVRFAFTTAALNGIPDETFLTGADGSGVFDSTVGVGAAR